MVDLLKTNNPGNGPFQDVPEEIFAEIGCRLVLLQNLELFLTFAIKVVFEDDPLKVKEGIFKEDNKSMGQLLNALRKKVSINDDFDACLKRTLKARNQFVHEFSLLFNLHSPNGIQEAIKFLSQTMDDLKEVTNLMKAALIVYGKDSDIIGPNLEENWRKHGDLNELESTHVPKVPNTFIKRSK
jgi:hypothetical protein